MYNDPYYDDGWQEELPPEKPPRRTIFKPRTRKPSFVLSIAVNAVRILALLVLLVGLAAVGAVMGIAKGYVETAPTLDLAALDDQAQTSFIYDSKGNLITDYKGTENRIMVSIAAMPTHLQNAFVAVEDARFFTHSGVDLKRIVGAFVSNLSSSTTQGGSTITQQLIKNTILSSEQKLQAQDPGSLSGAAAGNPLLQAPNSRSLSEHHLSGRKLLWCSGSGGGLLRQIFGRTDPQRVRHACRHDQ